MAKNEMESTKVKQSIIFILSSKVISIAHAFFLPLLHPLANVKLNLFHASKNPYFIRAEIITTCTPLQFGFICQIQIMAVGFL